RLEPSDPGELFALPPHVERGAWPLDGPELVRKVAVADGGFLAKSHVEAFPKGLAKVVEAAPVPELAPSGSSGLTGPDGLALERQLVCKRQPFLGPRQALGEIAGHQVDLCRPRVHVRQLAPGRFSLEDGHRTIQDEERSGDV